MKKPTLIKITGFVAGVAMVASAQFTANAQLQVQRPVHVVGTGSNAWHYLIMEGESYVYESDEDPTSRFVKVYANEDLLDFLEYPILGTNSTASKRGALIYKAPQGANFSDNVTYQVQFDTPGTYYFYMRFTMYENVGNGNYGNEDSFYLPQNFNLDPTNWPYSTVGGYTEGCCGNSGYLFILDYQGNGTRTQKNATDADYWEGHFHWNQLLTSQFMNLGLPEGQTNGIADDPHKYVVTPAMVGVPQTFTIGSRESGTAIDLFLFSTHTNLLNDYTQEQLDQLVNKASVQDAEDLVVTSSNTWHYLVMEGEDYLFELNPAVNASSNAVGFTSVGPSGSLTDFLGYPILGTNTLASKKGALIYVHPQGGNFSDKVTYQVQFGTTGTYYFYMRFTMYENVGNGNYGNEDSFYLPQNFNLDPTNWPYSTVGGYTEGCCGNSGFLFILDYQGNGTRTQKNATDVDYWEGNGFHWNQLLTSQFMNLGLPEGQTNGIADDPHKYVVTPAMVGVPQTFTIGSRESGVTPDLFLFSTHTNLLNDYTQAELDQIAVLPRLKITAAGANALVSWRTGTGFILESTGSLSPPSWTPVMDPATVVSNRNVLTVAPTGTRYYRLRQP